LSLKCAVEEPSDSMEETLCSQEKPTILPSNSSSTRKQEP